MKSIFDYSEISRLCGYTRNAINHNSKIEVHKEFIEYLNQKESEIRTEIKERFAKIAKQK